jgi:preprotein translocase subunit SecD
MKIRLAAFNIYLCGMGCVLLALAGCTSPLTYDSEEKDTARQITLLRMHVEELPDPLKRTIEVPVFRSRPVLVTVNRSPFLTEANVISAEIVDEPGGFSIQIEFERQGRWLLDKYTAQYYQRRIAVFAAFGEDRWLAAPKIQQVISDGKFRFTPDASREEAIRIVRGLKNLAKQMDHDPRF